MAQWLWNNKRGEYNMVFVFANTGQEEYETIQFCKKCEEHFGFKIHYIEAVVYDKMGKGNDFKEVESYNLDMEGAPFEAVIKKHGIPNKNFPHCTREMKAVPIRKFGKKYFNGQPYYLAIGIRHDEIDRVNPKHRKERIIYPLISERPMTKQKINFWWSQQPFRLELKGYQGNCKTCWKKSDRKLYQIAKENPSAFLFFDKMEARYGHFTPETRIQRMAQRGEVPKYPITFFRNNRSAYDITIEAKSFNGKVQDDHQQFDETESCELFSGCGDF